METRYWVPSLFITKGLWQCDQFRIASIILLIIDAWRSLARSHYLCNVENCHKSTQVLEETEYRNQENKEWCTKQTCRNTIRSCYNPSVTLKSPEIAVWVLDQMMSHWGVVIGYIWVFPRIIAIMMVDVDKQDWGTRFFTRHLKSLAYMPTVYFAFSFPLTM